MEAEIGRPLPRASDAYVEEDKWTEYVLADIGHGRQWRRVLLVEPTQAEQLWHALVRLAQGASVTELRPSRFGVGCGSGPSSRSTGAPASCYSPGTNDHPDAAPRLVTAFPAP
jgi:hypothetical protein